MVSPGSSSRRYVSRTLPTQTQAPGISRSVSTRQLSRASEMAASTSGEARPSVSTIEEEAEGDGVEALTTTERNRDVEEVAAIAFIAPRAL